MSVRPPPQADANAENSNQLTLSSSTSKWGKRPQRTAKAADVFDQSSAKPSPGAGGVAQNSSIDPDAPSLDTMAAKLDAEDGRKGTSSANPALSVAGQIRKRAKGAARLVRGWGQHVVDRVANKLPG